MTKIAVISDIHANLPALQAVLDVVSKEEVDLIVHLGDAIGIGPFPAECIAQLRQMPHFYSVRGNHDNYFIQGLPESPSPNMTLGELIHQRWTHDQLTAEDKEYVGSWPIFFRKILYGIELEFTHYGRHPLTSAFYPLIANPSSQQIKVLFKDRRGDLIFYGHDHQSADHYDGERRYINPGSLGCQPTATAPYLLLSISNQSFLLEKRFTRYDDSALQKAFRDRDVPEREMINNAFFGGRFG